MRWAYQPGSAAMQAGSGEAMSGLATMSGRLRRARLAASSDWRASLHAPADRKTMPETRYLQNAAAYCRLHVVAVEADALGELEPALDAAGRRAVAVMVDEARAPYAA